MKNNFAFILISILTFSIVSCSSEEPKAENKIDSTAPIVVAPAVKTTLQTDSGRMEIETVPGTQEGKAVLMDANGKIIARGMMIDGKPSGAWIRYDANGNIISAAHYEEGKPSHVLDINDFNFRTWENKQLGVKLQVPKNWKELPSSNPALVASFQKDDKDTAVHIKANFNIVRGALAPGDNLQKLAQMQIDMMHQNFDRVVPIDERTIVIDSCAAFRRYGTYRVENNEVGFLDVIIVHGNDAWFFSCEAQNKQDAEFLKYQGVFQQIVESFQRMK
jgi:hypothetical protein